MRTKLPCINGHILCIGREYEGPYKKVMSMPNMNIPIGSRADLQRTIDIAYDKLERQFCTKSEWRSVCTQACKTYIKQRRDTPVPTKYEAYRLKQLLKGLVLGPLDKNNGETWAMCPTLYQEGLTSLYNCDTGYEAVHLWKCSTNQCARWKHDITMHCINNKPAPNISKGSKEDIIKAWKHVYNTRKWKA